MALNITPAARFAAINAQRVLWAGGQDVAAAMVEGARYAESFPHSYTPAAVELSVEMIAALGEACGAFDFAPADEARLLELVQGFAARFENLHATREGRQTLWFA